jgi:hypothetical protein
VSGEAGFTDARSARCLDSAEPAIELVVKILAQRLRLVIRLPGVTGKLINGAFCGPGPCVSICSCAEIRHKWTPELNE